MTHLIVQSFNLFELVPRCFVLLNLVQLFRFIYQLTHYEIYISKLLIDLFIYLLLLSNSFPFWYWIVKMEKDRSGQLLYCKCESITYIIWMVKCVEIVIGYCKLAAIDRFLCVCCRPHSNGEISLSRCLPFSMRMMMKLTKSHLNHSIYLM